jgi:hypothetical protein
MKTPEEAAQQDREKEAARFCSYYRHVEQEHMRAATGFFYYMPGFHIHSEIPPLVRRDETAVENENGGNESEIPALARRDGDDISDLPDLMPPRFKSSGGARGGLIPT